MNSHILSRGGIPRVYLGTMTFGWAGQTSSVVDEKVASEMMERCFQSNAITLSIDTARIYSQGLSEAYCGNIASQWKLKYPDRILQIGTKAHPTGHALGLSPEGIQHQLQDSRILLQTQTLAEYYLHQPDVRYPLEDSLRYMNQLVQQGSVLRYGLSNYHVSEVKRAFHICDLNDWVKPSLYQGLYNPLNRLVEQELIPLLEQHDCSFIAYNPLAGGLLTGKYEWKENDTTTNTQEQQGLSHQQSSVSSSHSIHPAVTAEGRFKNNPNYIPRFYTLQNFKAVEIIRQACLQEGLSLIEATFRWLLFHSALNTSTTFAQTEKGVGQQHGLLLGASSFKQLDENLRACETAKPLSTHVLKAIDEAWKVTQLDPFPYWRSYSSDMPNRDLLPQGASYNFGAKP